MPEARPTLDQFEKLAGDVAALASEVPDIPEDLGLADLSRLVLQPDPTPAEVTDAICAQPGSFFWWSASAKQAAMEVERLEDGFELWWAGAMRETRGRLDGKPTESRVKEECLVANETDWAARKEALREARLRAEVLKYAVKAWDQRSVLMPALARLVSAEYGSAHPGGERTGAARPDPVLSHDDEPPPPKAVAPKVEGGTPVEDRPLF